MSRAEAETAACLTAGRFGTTPAEARRIAALAQEARDD
jgi:hypothetical protein